MIVSQYAYREHPKTEAAKWISATINFIMYTCAFINVTRQINRLRGPIALCHTVTKFILWECAPICESSVNQIVDSR